MTAAPDGPPISSITWRLDEDQSREDASLWATADGAAVRGHVTLVVDEEPAVIDYSVTTDGRWRTRHARAEIRIGTRPVVHLDAVADRGRWTIDGRVDPSLDGCVDIDLGWTPATNLLPIRRTALGVGDTAEIDAAWFRFPDLEFVRATQRYTRLDTHTWRYESGDFARDLTVDHHGFVTAYGDDLWQAVTAAD